MNRIIPPERLRDLPGAMQSLSFAEVAILRGRYGANVIVETPPAGWWPLLKETLKDPMLWFLLSTSIIFWVVGERTESLVLLVALMPFLGMDSFLHRRTQASTAGMSSQLASHATATRNGERVVVDAVDLVPGDLVEVNAGEPFPADGLVLLSESVHVDESALTGESYPIHKESALGFLKSPGKFAIEEKFWGFAGTRMLSGKVLLRVVFTGRETLYGEIVQTALGGSHERTPLQTAVSRLVMVLLAIATGFCILLAAARLYQGYGVLDAVISALTLAVAALPEEFPVVLTFFLGVGVYRLARRRALVRRAVVVENIGRVTTICSDKTGTITEGQLRLAHQYPAQGSSQEHLLATAAAASRRESGDPLDLAILALSPSRNVPTVIANFAFTEDRKRETCIVRNGDIASVAMKGAPETVLALCALPSDNRDWWHAEVIRLAAEGHKVIACASKAWNPDDDPGVEPSHDFHFDGLLAFEDPVRAGVGDALRQCRDAQIKVIMVTGDHPATAQAVAAEVGLGGTTPRTVSGEEMEQRLAKEGADFLRDVDVVARAVPAHKLALVKALQAIGELVAVTGDGVNDVPALQAADIGIAMGDRGTRSAREVAAIVLMDDNFRTIVGAIAEGRQLFSNLQASFQYLLMIHIPLVLTAALIPLVGYPILYLPVHIVWLELMIHPTALLVFQSLPAPEILQRRLSRGRPRFFGPMQLLVIALTSAIITALIYWTYGRSLGAGQDVEHARAMALATLILADVGITAVLSGLHDSTARLVTSFVLLSAPVLIQVPWLSGLLHVHPLHGDDWLLAGAGAVLACLPLLCERLIVHFRSIPAMKPAAI